MLQIVLICVGASLGALIRYGLGVSMNAVLPEMPLGTLCANILGGFLIGIFMGAVRDHPVFPEAVKIAIVVGFLGSLTTFSSFSAEAVSLLSFKQYVWATIMIVAHVAGSLSATFLGASLVKG